MVMLKDESMVRATTETKLAGVWWRAGKGRRRTPATPGRESGEGPYLSDEAVGIVAEWVSALSDRTLDWQYVRPSRYAVECLLVCDTDDLPDWPDLDEIVGEAEAARTQLDALYREAWGRPPSDAECFKLVGEVARMKQVRWLA